jgi:hypothetical protein
VVEIETTDKLTDPQVPVRSAIQTVVICGLAAAAAFGIARAIS